MSQSFISVAEMPIETLVRMGIGKITLVDRFVELIYLQLTWVIFPGPGYSGDRGAATSTAPLSKKADMRWVSCDWPGESAVKRCGRSLFLHLV